MTDLIDIHKKLECIIIYFLNANKEEKHGQNEKKNAILADFLCFYTRGVQLNVLHFYCAEKTVQGVNLIISLLQQCERVLIFSI